MSLIERERVKERESRDNTQAEKIQLQKEREGADKHRQIEKSKREFINR